MPLLVPTYCHYGPDYSTQTVGPEVCVGEWWVSMNATWHRFSQGGFVNTTFTSTYKRYEVGSVLNQIECDKPAQDSMWES